MPEWTTDENAALLTDLYQLTMLQAYEAEGMRDVAVFDLFFRRLVDRNYLVAAGLDTVLHFLETLHFDEDSVAYLRSLGLFSESFLDKLPDFRFSGSVFAAPEGTPVFAEEPVLQIVAPISEAQLVETFVLNQITFQTNVATKASRVVCAARGRRVIDFGARRMHGADASIRAARAYHIAGVHATSNVLAGKIYGLKVAGTMAHSYIQAHSDEDEALLAFSREYPGTTLLVDTFDTLAAIRRLTELARTYEEIRAIRAIRLDSGDLVDLAHQSRRILDDGGLGHVRIVASGNLDEFAIQRLIDADAPIDAFGVGTAMGTISDRPFLDSAYKLVSYGGQARMKLSTGKTNLPGLKQIYRINDDAGLTYDVIGLPDENVSGRPILQWMMIDGVRTAEGARARDLDASRAHHTKELTRLPSHLLTLEATTPAFRVDVSDGLRQLAGDVRRRLTST